jgi:hypothetical protein
MIEPRKVGRPRKHAQQPFDREREIRLAFEDMREQMNKVSDEFAELRACAATLVKLLYEERKS